MNGKLSAILLAAALAAAGSAAAGDFAGGYVGGDVGVNRSSTSGAYTTAPATAPSYGLEGGYGWDVGSNVLLGVDGHVDTYQEATHTPSGQYGSNAYGLGLKVGVSVDSLMPYARLGYDRTQGSGALSGFNSGSANGGLGLMYKIAPSWSVEGEWSSAAPSSGGLKLKSNTLNFGLNYHFDSPSGTHSGR
jgi:Outer membrane protein beta-barrel domain